MKHKAYWLKTDGEVVPVETIHILEVIKNPLRFNYTREVIEAIYAQQMEPMGHEGKAREIIMQDLIKNHGWIRLRFKPAPDLWVIELHTLSAEILRQLSDFFKQPGVVDFSNSDVRITELFKPEGLKHHNMSLRQVIRDDVATPEQYLESNLRD